MATFLRSCAFVLFLLGFHSSQAQVYGYVDGKVAQPLSLEQIEAIVTPESQKTDGISTWLALVAKLDTDAPELHLIDTEFFKVQPTKFGLHQAYAQYMGIVSSATDFIQKMKGANGEKRSLMALTLYLTKGPISVQDEKGREFTARWVVQNRRYRFVDSTKSFTDSMIKIQDTISRVFPLVSQMGRPHFITYNKAGSFRRPNLKTKDGRADIQAFNTQGFGVLTEKALFAKAGHALADVRVHNATENNEAFGFLKIVQNEEDQASLTPQHIAVFPSLPDRVPPVAAIVTLEAQTALSHINVLAINRGTLNVAIDQSIADQIKQKIDSAIQSGGGQTAFKLQVKDHQIALHTASEKQVADFQEKQKKRVGKVEIPEIDLSTGLEVVKATESHGPSQIGAKAANYGRIERLFKETGLVKPGFAIGFSLYKKIVKEEGIEERLIRPLVEAVQNGSLPPSEVNSRLKEIRDEISQARIPEKTLNSLIKLVTEGEYKTHRDEEKIRFRSSTNCEDLPRFNGAGLYLSEGIRLKHIRGAQSKAKSMRKLHEDLLLVLGSLWLPRAFWEREYFSIDHMKAGMAIQINPSFSDEFANGVIVASQKGNEIEYWVNSQFGEASVTNPEEGEIPESLKIKTAARTQSTIEADLERIDPTIMGRSNINSVFVNSEGKIISERRKLFAQLLMSTRQVLEKLIPDRTKYGIDIEYKLMKEGDQIQLYLKQARPLNLGLGH